MIISLAYHQKNMGMGLQNDHPEHQMWNTVDLNHEENETIIVTPSININGIIDVGHCHQSSNSSSLWQWIYNTHIAMDLQHQCSWQNRHQPTMPTVNNKKPGQLHTQWLIINYLHWHLAHSMAFQVVVLSEQCSKTNVITIQWQPFMWIILDLSSMAPQDQTWWPTSSKQSKWACQWPHQWQLCVGPPPTMTIYMNCPRLSPMVPPDQKPDDASSKQSSWACWWPHQWWCAWNHSHHDNVDDVDTIWLGSPVWLHHQG